MTTYAGQTLDTAMTIPFEGLSVRLKTNVEQWRMPFGARDPQPKQKFGAVVNHQPVTAVPIHTYGGYTLPSFVQDYYNRIHILPSVINLGAILGQQTRAVEIWNAYFEPRDFESLTVENAGGVSLTPFSASPPVTMGALQSLRYTMSVGVAGPPAVNALFTFAFDVGDLTLKVTGQRTAIFSFPPNWVEPYTERLSWLTNVLTSIDGREQRISRRLIPRRQFEYSVSQVQENYQLLDSLLVGWQARIYAFPVWHEAQRLPVAYPAGTIAIDCNTTDLSFIVDGYALLTMGPRQYEAVQIETVSPTGVTLTKPIGKDWPRFTTFAPTQLGRLNTEVEVNRPTAGIGQARLVFEVEDIFNIDPLPESTTYHSEELVMRKPNRANDVTVKYRRLQDRMDFDEGLISVEDNATRSFSIRAYEFLLKDRADLMKFRRWLHARQGQLKPFWMPVWENNIVIVQAVSAPDSSIAIQSNGFASLLEIDDARKNIALLHKNGTWYFREVSEYGPGPDDETEVAYLTTQMGIAAEIGDFVFGTFLDYAVLNSDEFEFSYLKDDAANVSLATRSVIQ